MHKDRSPLTKTASQARPSSPLGPPWLAGTAPRVCAAVRPVRRLAGNRRHVRDGGGPDTVCSWCETVSTAAVSACTAWTTASRTASARGATCRSRLHLTTAQLGLYLPPRARIG